MKKYFTALLLALTLAGAGCITVTDTTTPPDSSSSAKLGEPVRFEHVGQAIVFQNGLLLTLKDMRDSRCPQGVQCIWAGELSYDFKFIDSLSSYSSGDTEITLGTVTKPSIETGGYRLTLVAPEGLSAEGDKLMPTVLVEFAKSPSIDNDTYEEDAEGGEGVFCTMDAKQCPDGSYVGRTPPSCEFSACP